MDVFARISETASNIFANSAANIAQAQMGLVVALFILSLVGMFIGWRFGNVRLIVASGTVIVTATGVVLFGQNIQDIGTRVISFAVGLALRAAGSGQNPDAFASGFGSFYVPGQVHFDNMMAMADEACGIIGWTCGWWSPSYFSFAIVGWAAWLVTTIGALLFWISVFAFKLGVIGTLVLSAFVVWKTTRHMALAPISFCVKAAIYTFCITFALTAGNIVLNSIELVTEPAWYHALPLLVAVLGYALVIGFSSKLAAGLASGAMTTASNMVGPALTALSMARATGTGRAVTSFFARHMGSGSMPSGGGNSWQNRTVNAMHAGGGDHAARPATPHNRTGGTGPRGGGEW